MMEKRVMIDQFAVVSNDHEGTKKALESIGAEQWVVDYAEAEGEIRGKKVDNKIKLSFNYEIGPYEFEVLTLLEGETFHQELEPFGFGHFGVHVEDAEEFSNDIARDEGWEIIGWMKTKNHTSTKNLYHYVFLENKKLNVFYKVIQRLPGKGKEDVYSPSVHYLNVMNQARNLMLSKVNDYGKRRYTKKSKDFDMMMCYSDVYRKFIRLENHFENKAEMENEKIIDTMYDMLNYLVMMIQMHERHEVRE